VATQLAGEAALAAAEGHQASATRLFHRAALLYGRGQYHLFEDSELKRRLYTRFAGVLLGGDRRLAGAHLA